AFRLGSLAQLLPVMAKEQVGLDQPGAILVQSFFDGFLNEAVGRGVAFLLLPEPQAQQDTQPIRLQSQDRVGLAEKKNLFCPRLANARKPLEGFPGLGDWQLEYGAQIAVKLLQSDLRRLAELLGKLLGHDSVAGHFEERLIGCRENLA